MTEMTTIFNQFAFPVAVVMALMWYIVTTHKAHREDLAAKDKQITDLVNSHQEETKQLTDAINQMTVVLEGLRVLMGEGAQNGKAD